MSSVQTSFRTISTTDNIDKICLMQANSKDDVIIERTFSYDILLFQHIDEESRCHYTLLFIVIRNQDF